MPVGLLILFVDLLIYNISRKIWLHIVVSNIWVAFPNQHVYDVQKPVTEIPRGLVNIDRWAFVTLQLIHNVVHLKEFYFLFCSRSYIRYQGRVQADPKVLDFWEQGAQHLLRPTMVQQEMLSKPELAVTGKLRYNRVNLGHRQQQPNRHHSVTSFNFPFDNGERIRDIQQNISRFKFLSKKVGNEWNS